MEKKKDTFPFTSTRRLFKYLPSGQLCCILRCFAFALKRKQIGLRCSGMGTGRGTEACPHPALVPRSPTHAKSCLRSVEGGDSHAIRVGSQRSWVKHQKRILESVLGRFTIPDLNFFLDILQLHWSDTHAALLYAFKDPRSAAARLLWSLIFTYVSPVHFAKQLCGEIGRLNSQPGRAKDYKSA